MKKFVCLCSVAAMLFALAVPMFASGMSGIAGAGEGSGGGVISDQVAPNDGTDAPFDAGNNARTGDIQNNGGASDGSAGGTANGTNPGDSGANSGISDNSANNSATDSAVQPSSGTSWFAVIIAILIVAAIIALVVALLPKRRSM